MLQLRTRVDRGWLIFARNIVFCSNDISNINYIHVFSLSLSNLIIYIHNLYMCVCARVCVCVFVCACGCLFLFVCVHTCFYEGSIYAIIFCFIFCYWYISMLYVSTSLLLCMSSFAFPSRVCNGLASGFQDVCHARSTLERDIAAGSVIDAGTRCLIVNY